MTRKPWGRSRYSEAFKKSSSSPNAGQRGLDGIVSKKSHAPYKTG
jgi:ATP-dependent DNA ligase